MLNKLTNNKQGERMKTYTIQFDDTLIKGQTRFITTDDQDVVEYYVSKYWKNQIDNLKVTNEVTNQIYDYDKIPSLARKERA